MSWHSKTESRLTERLARETADLRRSLHQFPGRGKNLGVSLGGSGSFIAGGVGAPVAVPPTIVETYRLSVSSGSDNTAYNRIAAAGASLQVRSGHIDNGVRSAPRVQFIDGEAWDGRTLYLGPVQGVALTIATGGSIVDMTADITVEYGYPVTLLYSGGSWRITADPGEAARIQREIGGLDAGIDTYTGSADPTVTAPTSAPKVGDLYYRADGSVWRYSGSASGWVQVVAAGGFVAVGPLRAGRGPSTTRATLALRRPDSLRDDVPTTQHPNGTPLMVDDNGNAASVGANFANAHGATEIAALAAFGQGYSETGIVGGDNLVHFRFELQYSAYEPVPAGTTAWGAGYTGTGRWGGLAELVDVNTGAADEFWPADSLAFYLPGGTWWYPFGDFVWRNRPTRTPAPAPASNNGPTLQPLDLWFKPGTTILLEGARPLATLPWVLQVRKNGRLSLFNRSAAVLTGSTATATVPVDDHDFGTPLTLGIARVGTITLSNFPDSGELDVRIEDDRAVGTTPALTGALNLAVDCINDPDMAAVDLLGAGSDAAGSGLTTARALPAADRNLEPDDYLAVRIKRNAGHPLSRPRVVSLKKNDEDAIGPDSVPAAPALSDGGSSSSSLTVLWTIPGTRLTPGTRALPTLYELQYRALANGFDWSTDGLTTLNFGEADAVVRAPNGDLVNWHHLSGLSASQRYIFRVRARNRHGWGPHGQIAISTEALPVIPQGPSWINLQPFTATLVQTPIPNANAAHADRYKLRLTWTAPTGANAARYGYRAVIVGGDPFWPAGGDQTVNPAAHVASVDFAGEPGESYQVRVLQYGSLTLRGETRFSLLGSVLTGTVAVRALTVPSVGVYTTEALARAARDAGDVDIALAPVVAGIFVAVRFPSSTVASVDYRRSIASNADPRFTDSIANPAASNDAEWTNGPIAADTYYLKFRWRTAAGTTSGLSAEATVVVSRYYLAPEGTRAERITTAPTDSVLNPFIDPNAVGTSSTVGYADYNPLDVGAVRARWADDDDNDYRGETYALWAQAVTPLGTVPWQRTSRSVRRPRLNTPADQDPDDRDRRIQWYDFVFSDIARGDYNLALRATNLLGHSPLGGLRSGAEVRPNRYEPPASPSTVTTLALRTAASWNSQGVALALLNSTSARDIERARILYALFVVSQNATTAPWLVWSRPTTGPNTQRRYMDWWAVQFRLLGARAGTTAGRVNTVPGIYLGNPYSALGAAAGSIGAFNVSTTTSRILVRRGPIAADARIASQRPAASQQSVQAGEPTLRNAVSVQAFRAYRSSAARSIYAFYSSATPTPTLLSKWLGDAPGRAGYHVAQGRLYLRRPPNWYYLQFA